MTRRFTAAVCRPGTCRFDRSLGSELIVRSCCLTDVAPGAFKVKCASASVWLASRRMDDPLEIIGDWVDALTEQYGQDGAPIEQAQQSLMPLMPLIQSAP